MVPASQCHPGNELVHGVVKALGTGQLWPSLEPLASRASSCIGLDESLQDSGLVLKADGQPRALTHCAPLLCPVPLFHPHKLWRERGSVGYPPTR